MNTQLGLLGKKVGMTQIFLDDGTRVPVTVVQVAGNTVTAHRTEARDGYTALQVGFEEQKPSRMGKADLGRFKGAEVSPRKHVREFRVPADALEKHPIGSDLPLDMFTEGQLVDVTGISKGKGFQGVFKRHNMSGKPATHGTHEYFRHGGSIGCRKTPGRVIPGKRMPGRMGTDTVTQQNMQVAKVMADEGVVLVRGAVPGGKNSYITLRHALKPAIRAQAAKK